MSTIIITNMNITMNMVMNMVMNTTIIMLMTRITIMTTSRVHRAH